MNDNKAGLSKHDVLNATDLAVLEQYGNFNALEYLGPGKRASIRPDI